MIELRIEKVFLTGLKDDSKSGWYFIARGTDWRESPYFKRYEEAQEWIETEGNKNGNEEDR